MRWLSYVKVASVYQWLNKQNLKAIVSMWEILEKIKVWKVKFTNFDFAKFFWWKKSESDTEIVFHLFCFCRKTLARQIDDQLLCVEKQSTAFVSVVNLNILLNSHEL